MAPPDKKDSTKQAIIPYTTAVITVAGAEDEADSGVAYFVDEDGRYYYQPTVEGQEFVMNNQTTSQDTEGTQESDTMLTDQEAEGYQTVTLVPSETNGEVSYVLVVQEENKAMVNIDLKVDQSEAGEKGNDDVYNFEEEEAGEEASEEEDDAPEGRPKPQKKSKHTRLNFQCNFCSYTSHRRDFSSFLHMDKEDLDSLHDIRVVDPTNASEMMKLGLANNEMKRGELVTVTDGDGQQYVVLEVIQLEDGTEQQVAVVAPDYMEEDAQEEGEEEEEEEEEEEGDAEMSYGGKSSENDNNIKLEKEVDSCFGFDVGRKRKFVLRPVPPRVAYVETPDSPRVHPFQCLKNYKRKRSAPSCTEVSSSNAEVSSSNAKVSSSNTEVTSSEPRVSISVDICSADGNVKPNDEAAVSLSDNPQPSQAPAALAGSPQSRQTTRSPDGVREVVDRILEIYLEARLLYGATEIMHLCYSMDSLLK
ncbi:hypothetical protein B5X24_HaOG210901 [Helicoverpa armigera]|uniref:Uncharacterized protein n=1 Tax=Helicoverpa armigera TaxID=29058 RepID=A0A2W1BFU5_HELAM|nr:hypothetical protein B5X24_HaOG210901 [Helicoverpa armigera]